MSDDPQPSCSKEIIPKSIGSLITSECPPPFSSTDRVERVKSAASFSTISRSSDEQPDEICDRCKSLTDNAFRAQNSAHCLASELSRLRSVSVENEQIRRALAENHTFIQGLLNTRSGADSRIADLEAELNQEKKRNKDLQNTCTEFQKKARDSQAHLNAANEWRAKYDLSQEVLEKVNNTRTSLEDKIGQSLLIAKQWREKYLLLTKRMERTDSEHSVLKERIKMINKLLPSLLSITDNVLEMQNATPAVRKKCERFADPLLRASLFGKRPHRKADGESDDESIADALEQAMTADFAGTSSSRSDSMVTVKEREKAANGLPVLSDSEGEREVPDDMEMLSFKEPKVRVGRERIAANNVPNLNKPGSNRATASASARPVEMEIHGFGGRKAKNPRRSPVKSKQLPHDSLPESQRVQPLANRLSAEENALYERVSRSKTSVRTLSQSSTSPVKKSKSPVKRGESEKTQPQRFTSPPALHPRKPVGGATTRSIGRSSVPFAVPVVKPSEMANHDDAAGTRSIHGRKTMSVREQQSKMNVAERIAALKKEQAEKTASKGSAVNLESKASVPKLEAKPLADVAAVDVTESKVPTMGSEKKPPLADTAEPGSSTVSEELAIEENGMLMEDGDNDAQELSDNQGLVEEPMEMEPMLNGDVTAAVSVSEDHMHEEDQQDMVPLDDLDDFMDFVPPVMEEADGAEEGVQGTSQERSRALPSYADSIHQTVLGSPKKVKPITPARVKKVSVSVDLMLSESESEDEEDVHEASTAETAKTPTVDEVGNGEQEKLQIADSSKSSATEPSSVSSANAERETLDEVTVDVPDAESAESTSRPPKDPSPERVPIRSSEVFFTPPRPRKLASQETRSVLEEDLMLSSPEKSECGESPVTGMGRRTRSRTRTESTSSVASTASTSSKSLEQPIFKSPRATRQKRISTAATATEDKSSKAPSTPEPQKPLPFTPRAKAKQDSESYPSTRVSSIPVPEKSLMDDLLAGAKQASEPLRRVSSVPIPAKSPTDDVLSVVKQESEPPTTLSLKPAPQKSLPSRAKLDSNPSTRVSSTPFAEKSLMDDLLSGAKRESMPSKRVPAASPKKPPPPPKPEPAFVLDKILAARQKAQGYGPRIRGGTDSGPPSHPEHSCSPSTSTAQGPEADQKPPAPGNTSAAETSEPLKAVQTLGRARVARQRPTAPPVKIVTIPPHRALAKNTNVSLKSPMTTASVKKVSKKTEAQNFEPTTSESTSTVESSVLPGAEDKPTRAQENAQTSEEYEKPVVRRQRVARSGQARTSISSSGNADVARDAQEGQASTSVTEPGFGPGPGSKESDLSADEEPVLSIQEEELDDEMEKDAVLFGGSHTVAAPEPEPSPVPVRKPNKRQVITPRQSAAANSGTGTRLQKTRTVSKKVVETPPVCLPTTSTPSLLDGILGSMDATTRIETPKLNSTAVSTPAQRRKVKVAESPVKTLSDSDDSQVMIVGEDGPDEPTERNETNVEDVEAPKTSSDSEDSPMMIVCDEEEEEHVPATTTESSDIKEQERDTQEQEVRNVVIDSTDESDSDADEMCIVEELEDNDEDVEPPATTRTSLVPKEEGKAKDMGEVVPKRVAAPAQRIIPPRFMDTSTLKQAAQKPNPARAPGGLSALRSKLSGGRGKDLLHLSKTMSKACKSLNQRASAPSKVTATATEIKKLPLTIPSTSNAHTAGKQEKEAESSVVTLSHPIAKVPSSAVVRKPQVSTPATVSRTTRPPVKTTTVQRLKAVGSDISAKNAAKSSSIAQAQPFMDAPVGHAGKGQKRALLIDIPSHYQAKRTKASLGGASSQLFTLLDVVCGGASLEVALRDNNIDLDGLVEAISVDEAANVVTQMVNNVEVGDMWPGLVAAVSSGRPSSLAQYCRAKAEMSILEVVNQLDVDGELFDKIFRLLFSSIISQSSYTTIQLCKLIRMCTNLLWYNETSMEAKIAEAKKLFTFLLRERSGEVVLTSLCYTGLGLCAPLIQWIWDSESEETEEVREARLLLRIHLINRGDKQKVLQLCAPELDDLPDIFSPASSEELVEWWREAVMKADGMALTDVTLAGNTTQLSASLLSHLVFTARLISQRHHSSVEKISMFHGLLSQTMDIVSRWHADSEDSSTQVGLFADISSLSLRSNERDSFRFAVRIRLLSLIVHDILLHGKAEVRQNLCDTLRIAIGQARTIIYRFGDRIHSRSADASILQCVIQTTKEWLDVCQHFTHHTLLDMVSK